ncbi:MAG TPA: hypothetical protein ENH96_04410 [Chlamydiae bacterium]|nr:hypothetical protein [Chlamydiota bacterium]
MAIIPQMPGQVIAQPVPALLPKTPIFGSEFNEGKSSLDTAKDFTNYLGRVHKKYSGMDTANIENLVNRLLKEQDQTFMNFVREETSLRDTFYNRFVQAKTPLGEVLQELQSSQESPNRKLLSKEIFRQAEKEAGELTKKEVALASEKGDRKVSNEVSHLLKRQTSNNVTKIGSEFQVNTYTDNDQQDPSVASLSTGKFVVTWQSYEQDGSGWGVYGQIFNVDGTKNGSEFRVNTYITNQQKNPSAASLSNGEFVVVWQSWTQDGDLDGIYGQIFNTNGTKKGLEFQINTWVNNSQEEPSVASFDDGKFVVVWQGRGGQDGDLIGVFGQIFNADGTKSGSEFQVNTYTLNHQYESSVASLSTGKFVVTWTSLYQDGDQGGVYGQILNADGTKSGSEFQINTYTTDAQQFPSVTSLSNNKFVVTWQDGGQDGSFAGIFGQIFNSDGTKSGIEFQVNTYTIDSQMIPSVASLSNGKFVVTWTSLNQDGDLYGVYGQAFNAAGTKSGPEFQINTHTTDNQYRSSVATLGNDKFVVTWQSQYQDGSDYGIYGQIFEAIIPTSSSISSTTSSTSSSTSSSLLPSSTSSNSLSTKNVQSLSNSGNPYSTSSNNKRLITWLAVSIIGCLGSSSLLGYLYLRKRRSSDYSKASSLESIRVDSTITFELEPTIKRYHKEIGGEYFQLSKIDKFEAEDIYKQTGYLIVIPEGKSVIKHVVGIIASKICPYMP